LSEVVLPAVEMLDVSCVADWLVTGSSLDAGSWLDAETPPNAERLLDAVVDAGDATDFVVAVNVVGNASWSCRDDVRALDTDDGRMLT
jgi:hypothetical protein